MATVQLQVDRTREGLGLWRRWVAASTVGLAVGWAVFALVADGLGGPEGTRRSDNAHLLGLLMAGSLVGLLQGAVLRRQASQAARAAMASGLGLAVGFMAGYALGGPPVDFLLGFTMLGIAGGIAQWRLLRMRVRRAGWWVPASGLGFAVGGAAGVAAVVLVADAADQVLGSGLVAFAAVLALLGAVGGATGGAITAIMLVRLLRQPASPALEGRSSSRIELLAPLHTEDVQVMRASALPADRTSRLLDRRSRGAPPDR